MNVIAQGLEGYTVEDMSEIAQSFIADKVDYVDEDFKIVKMALIGSRIKNNHRLDSDVDIAFIYEGDCRSDAMSDALNSNPLVINGIRVDFVPFSLQKREFFRLNEPQQELPLKLEGDLKDVSEEDKMATFLALSLFSDVDHPAKLISFGLVHNIQRAETWEDIKETQLDFAEQILEMFPENYEDSKSYIDDLYPLEGKELEVFLKEKCGFYLYPNLEVAFSLPKGIIEGNNILRVA